MYQMHLNSDRLLEWYFTTPSDLTQTIIAIFFGVMLLVFLCVQIYIHARYQRDLKLKKEAIEDKFEEFFQEIRLNQYSTF